jgi:hypothetical protein
VAELADQLRDYIEPTQRWTSTRRGAQYVWVALDGGGAFFTLSVTGKLVLYSCVHVDEKSAITACLVDVRQSYEQTREAYIRAEKVLIDTEARLSELGKAADPGK